MFRSGQQIRGQHHNRLDVSAGRIINNKDRHGRDLEEQNYALSEEKWLQAEADQ